jgi:hypothetical protein
MAVTDFSLTAAGSRTSARANSCCVRTSRVLVTAGAVSAAVANCSVKQIVRRSESVPAGVERMIWMRDTRTSRSFAARRTEGGERRGIGGGTGSAAGEGSVVGNDLVWDGFPSAEDDMLEFFIFFVYDVRRVKKVRTIIPVV